MNANNKLHLLRERKTKNTCCPKCGKHIIHAKDRIFKSFTLTGSCPYCGCIYRNPTITNRASLYAGVFLSVIMVDIFAERFHISSIVALPIGIALGIVLLGSSLFLTSIMFGIVGLFIFPLEEIHQ